MILNLRPACYRESFHRAFAGLGPEIVDLPILTPEPTFVACPAADGFDAIVLTSQIALDFMTPTEAWRHLPVFAVGEATARAAQKAGFPRVHDGGGDAASLTQRLAAAQFQRALYPSAAEAAVDVSAAFPGRIVRVPVYRTTAREDVPADVADAIRGSRVVLAPIFSRRTGLAFSATAKRAGLKDAVIAVGISWAAITIDHPGWSGAIVAERPTEAAIVSALRVALG